MNISRHRPLMVVIGVILLFFLSRWLIEGAYFRKDLVFITTPLENLYGSLQRSGESPLWAPELAGGYPLLANGQLGFWYPPHMLLRHFLPGVWVLNLSLLGHALLGGVGMYWLLRGNKLRETAAESGALLFALGATMVGKYESLNLILPFMWVPLLLYLLQLFMATGRAKYFFVWVGANVLSILVGHPQMAVYILILNGLFIVCLLSGQWRWWPRALAILFGVALVIGLTSFYWLPILDVLPETDRAEGTLKPNEQGMFDNQFTPQAFWGLFLPHPFGHHETYTGPTSENELSSYYGPVALLMAAVGLGISRRTFSLWWVAIVFSLVGLALATGGYSPLFRWLVDHGWTYFNFPSRFFFYTHVGLVFFVAAGVEGLEQYVHQRVMRIVLFLSIVGPALWVSWGWHEGVPWSLAREPVLVQRLHEERGTVRVLAGTRLDGIAPDENFKIKLWNPVCSKCQYQQRFVSPFPKFDGVTIKVSKQSMSVGVVTLRVYTGGGQLLREAQQVHPTNIMDNEWTTFSFASVSEALDKEFYLELTSTIEAKLAPRLWIHTNPVEQYDPTGRLYNCTSGTCTAVLDADAAFALRVTSDAVSYYDALAPYVAAGFGLGSTQWAGSLPILKVKEYLTPFDTWGDPFRGGWRTMMNRFGTTHLIGVFPPHRALSLEGFTLLTVVPYGESFLHLYRNEQVWPRVHFAENVRAFTSSLDQVNRLLKTSADERLTVLADVPADATFVIEGARAEVTADERTVVEIHTEQRADGFLVLRDVLVKGWTATIDSEPVPIYRVDGIFRGVFVPAGNHTVRFEYGPAWIRLALYIEGVSVTILLGLLAGTYLGRRRSSVTVKP